MSQTIHKYVLTERESAIVRMHEGAEVLAVGSQNEHLVMWVSVDVTREIVSTNLLIVGTGWQFEVSQGMRYAGTAQCGPFVWHVFVHDARAITDRHTPANGEPVAKPSVRDENLQRIAARAREVHNVVMTPGDHPAFHAKVMEDHRRTWPMLWAALDRLFDAL